MESGFVTPAGAPAPKMGYQRGLDGLRALSVIGVMLYHAGFGWVHGGFFGVEVFFVVSGYLITSLLLDEREGSGAVGLGQFWLRRARRLLPALFTMLLAVAVWAKFFGSAEQQSTLRRDLPWSLLYLGNWGQILGKAAYFSSADPPLLRHLWSLAVEEQWYLIWPLVFVAAFALGKGGLRVRGGFFVASAIGVMVLTYWLHSAGNEAGTISVFGRTANRTNFMYLSTLTRASGLLLGAGCAFVWRPWRRTHDPRVGRVLDPLGAAAVAGLGCILAVAELTDGYIYQWLLAVVSVLSMVAIAVVVHPDATAMRLVFGSRPLVEIGKRSYGLYLWHWPIFVIGKVYHTGNWGRFGLAMLATIAVSEVCYRFVEIPIRRSVIGEWVHSLHLAQGEQRVQRVRVTFAASLTAAVIVGLLASFYSRVQPFDVAAGGEVVSFSVPGVATAPSVASLAPELPAATSSTVPAPPTTIATLPRRLAIVGDSQAHSLAINMPKGIESTFIIEDGSFEGCGVYDLGSVLTARKGFRRSFTDCAGWAEKWAKATTRSRAEVALVVLGAWDLFDVQLDDRVLTFGTPEADAYYLTHLQEGIDAVKATGTQVALLEIPCMRPVDVKGAGVPALPERGDDARVAHVNDLFRQLAAADPAHVFFVAGPTAWCNDPAINTDLGYRWDGVHYYQPGANLVMEAIAPALLQIPVPAAG